MVPGDHCHISQSPLKGWVTFPITHLKIKPWPLPLLPASKHKLPRSLPCLWVQLSLNWEENVSFPSSGFSATSESLSSKEFCWQGGWAVECRMEGLRGSEPSVPESILKPTGRLLSLQHSDSRVWTGRQDLPFIGPSAGRGLLLLAGKNSIFLQLLPLLRTWAGLVGGMLVVVFPLRSPTQLRGGRLL